jgi:DNA polymerase III subunit delta
VKLPPARLSAFLRQPDPAVRAMLVFGPDAGLVRERADILARHVAPDPRDPFRVSDMTAAALVADPARLNDEAAQLSLTGGRRLVRVREAGDAAAALFKRFLAAPPPGDGVVLVEGGDLPSRSSLRKAFEAAPAAVAVACYADSPRDLAALVGEVLGAHRVAVTEAARDYLVAQLGGDRQVSRQELEKLALYAGDGGRVDAADAAAVVGDSADITIDDAVSAALEGDAPALERALFRAFAEGESPVTLLRAALRHGQRLNQVGGGVADGVPLEAALRALRPPLFRQQQERFQRQLRLWPAPRSTALLVALTEAEVNAKTTGLPPETICRDALLRIARAAAARRGR